MDLSRDGSVRLAQFLDQRQTVAFDVERFEQNPVTGLELPVCFNMALADARVRAELDRQDSAYGGFGSLSFALGPDLLGLQDGDGQRTRLLALDRANHHPAKAAKPFREGPGAFQGDVAVSLDALALRGAALAEATPKGGVLLPEFDDLPLQLREARLELANQFTEFGSLTVFAAGFVPSIPACGRLGRDALDPLLAGLGDEGNLDLLALPDRAVRAVRSLLCS